MKSLADTVRARERMAIKAPECMQPGKWECINRSMVKWLEIHLHLDSSL